MLCRTEFFFTAHKNLRNQPLAQAKRFSLGPVELPDAEGGAREEEVPDHGRHHLLLGKEPLRGSKRNQWTNER